MASRRNGTLYIGSSSDLVKRAWQHRTGAMPGFTQRYGCRMLVWFARFDDIADARQCELRMKEWKRAWKLRAIEDLNPNWRDLWDDISR
jgi:putative endonuclease